MENFKGIEIIGNERDISKSKTKRNNYRSKRI